MTLLNTMRSALWFSVACVAFVQLAFPADIATLRNGFAIRHETREYRGAITRLYLGPNSSDYVDVATADIVNIEKDLSPAPATARTVAASTPDLHSAIAGASAETRVDPDLISSIIRAESGFNARATSRKGARGLMQLMPDTASRLGVKDSFDPSANVQGGTRYFNQLLESYHNDMAKALAAYNAGPQRVAQYHGIPPYHETRVYVAKVIRDFNRRKLTQTSPSKTVNPRRKPNPRRAISPGS